MIKVGPFPHFAASNFNIQEVINFQTYEKLPHWQPWFPFPSFLANINRQNRFIAWHSRYPTVQPHTYEYRLLRSITDNDLEQTTKVLKKADIRYPTLINQPIDKQYNFTPLQYACVTNNYPAIQLLLMYGANINLPDQQGNTPLMLAVMNQSLQSINSLMKSGCDWRIANKYGITPENRAKEINREFIGDFIKDFASKIQIQQTKKLKKKDKIQIKDLVITRKFPRFRARLDIQKMTESPFWKFVDEYRINAPRIIKNPFNNFSGDYRISFNNF